MKRRIMDKVASNINAAYWQEADRLRRLAGSQGQVLDGRMVLHFHRLAWQNAMKVVFRGREYGRDGSHVLGGAEAAIFEELAEALCFATGVPFDELRSTSSAQARSERVVRAWVLLRQLSEIDGPLLEEVRQREDAFRFLHGELNAIPPGADREVDEIRVEFESAYPGELARTNL
jgi:hypothetical protein